MENKHTTLVIAYYWPPSSGGGLMRWFKMSKYWQDQNHRLIIYTPDLDNPPGYDPSLEDQIPKDLTVIKTPILEPHKLYARFMGKKDKGVYSGFINDDKKTWKSKLSIWIRSNLFIPDARMLWIKPSIKYLNKFLQENKVDTVISTGPPHSMHLIALGLKKKKNLTFNWIADFRDPWTNIDYAEQLNLTKWADNKNRALERKVFDSADKVVTVTWSSVNEFSKIAEKNNIEVITNGYDHADFENLNPKLDEKFSICHLGSMNPNRNPTVLWKALEKLCSQDRAFAQKLEIKLIGDVDFKIIQDVKDHSLDNYLVKKDFMPHKQGLTELASSQIVLLMMFQSKLTKSIIPGKAYEYLAVNRPILALGKPGSDVERVLKTSPESVLFDFDDVQGVINYLKIAFEKYQHKTLKVTNENIEKFSRKNLAQQYKSLIDKM